MENPNENPGSPRPRRHKEFEDPHFHDDVDIVPPDDVDQPGTKPPVKRKPPRRPPSRRHYEEG